MGVTAPTLRLAKRWGVGAWSEKVCGLACRIRYLLLTYNAPGGKEIWAAMSEAEQQAEEDEYADLIRAMRDSDAFIAEKNAR